MRQLGGDRRYASRDPVTTKVPTRFRATVELPHPLTIFGLRMGGCFPLSLLGGHTILLDRSVIRRLELLSRTNSNVRNDDRYWLAMLDDPSVTLNVGLSSFEGFRRPLNFAEFFDHHDEVCATVSQVIPRARVLAYATADRSKIYDLQRESEARYRAECEFLCEVAPLLAVRSADRELDQIAQVLKRCAHKLHLKGRSLVVLASFACLYADKRGAFSSALRVVKPKPRYAAEQAHNAICDLRALELLVSSSTMAVGPVAICTADRALAAFWIELGVREVERTSERSIQYAFSIDRLFPRLTGSDTARERDS